MSQSSSGYEYGKFPAIIVSYNGSTRECIIKTPMGDEVDAEINYPIGDNSALTEIKINAGDKVWCEYIQGDTRRALIVGYRNPQSGNTTGTRRFIQDEIILEASQSIKFMVGGMLVEVTNSDLIINGIPFLTHVHYVPREGADSQKPK